MSNNTIIEIRKFEVEDFISIEHGDKAISLTIFHGKVQVGTPGWANQIELSPEKAEALAEELIKHSVLVRKKQSEQTKGGEIL